MASSRIKKKDIQKVIDTKKIELNKKRDFLKKLKRTIELENIQISELEGAILALHELVTGEKVN